MLRRTAAALVAAAALATGALAATTATGAGAAPDPEGSYLVVLRDDVADAHGVADEHRRTHDARVAHVYETALKGYAATLRASEAAALRRDRRVAYVEADQVVHADATQVNAPWGLDRIDQATGGAALDSTYTTAGSGAGVTAYIVDTGINVSHIDFGGRATGGYDAVTAGGAAADCNGHGTHVAGTVGGTTYGVAKSVQLVAVRVLDCSGSGSWSGVIAGLDWVAAHHAGPSVANMSLGGGASTAVDSAVKRLIDSGVTVAVAAGNGNQAGVAQDACKTSPARVAAAITVSATDSSDRKTSWANYGNCVDWFAPGLNIASDWYTTDSATNTISGTSMATPHTTGAAAVFLGDFPGSTTAQVRDGLAARTSKGVVKQAKSTNANLLNVAGL